jgi:glucokinase
VIVGLDVRHRSVCALLVDEQGVIAAREARPVWTAAAVADVVRAIGGDAATGLGIAVGDPADPGTTDLVAAAAGVLQRTGPPRVVTKGSAVVAAEQWRGAAQGARYVVALTTGECVRAGILIDGRIFDGANGLAGAAAWLALNPVERDEYRRVGCLEAEVGASAIVRRLAWRIKAGDRSKALDLAGGKLSAITVQHVFEAARARDPVALSVVRDTARYIGMAIGNLVAIVDPEVVVLSGLIADASDLLLEPVQAEAARRVAARPAGAFRVVAGVLGDDAAAIGAARAAMLAR